MCVHRALPAAEIGLQAYCPVGKFTLEVNVAFPVLPLTEALMTSFPPCGFSEHGIADRKYGLSPPKCPLLAPLGPYIFLGYVARHAV